MNTNNKIINRLEFLLEFLKKNENLINFNIISKDFDKFESKLKSSINYTSEIKELFSNKTIFPNLASIKEFIKNKFNIVINERSTKGVLSNIMFYVLIDPTLTEKISKEIEKSKPKIIKITPKSRPRKTKEKIIDKSWKDWLQYSPDELREHLNNLTVKQIKMLVGKLLNSSEKNVRKAQLIENIIKKIKKLDTIYKMGPG